MMLATMKNKIVRLLGKLQPYARSRNHRFFSDESVTNYNIPAGIPGSGVGKGGGGGGSVRQSGGGLGKYAAAQEEGYFHHKQREQLEKIKKQLKAGQINLDQKPEHKSE